MEDIASEYYRYAEENNLNGYIIYYSATRCYFKRYIVKDNVRGGYGSIMEVWVVINACPMYHVEFDIDQCVVQYDKDYPFIYVMASDKKEARVYTFDKQLIDTISYKGRVGFDL